MVEMSGPAAVPVEVRAVAADAAGRGVDLGAGLDRVGHLLERLLGRLRGP